MWEVGGDAWGWHRRLHAWEEESVTECFILLHDVVLQANVHSDGGGLLIPLKFIQRRELTSFSRKGIDR